MRKKAEIIRVLFVSKIKVICEVENPVGERKTKGLGQAI